MQFVEPAYPRPSVFTLQGRLPAVACAAEDGTVAGRTAKHPAATVVELRHGEEVSQREGVKTFLVVASVAQ
nr:hypothetical protein [Parabacteroides gordonii]